MNSFSNNITNSLENSRNSLRRIARNDDTEFSHQSVLNAMEKFVKSVNTMDETILVPCRLMDLKVGDENDPTSKCTTKKHTNNIIINNNKNSKQCVQELLNLSDLFDIYNMLNNVKADLLWGQTDTKNQEELVTNNSTNTNTPTITTTTTNTTSTITSNNVKGHVRRPSTVSVTSTNSSSSSTISDSESDGGNENDSGIEESQDGSYDNQTDKVADNFRRHLIGLTQSLRQMTEAAQYLTSRYQHDIGGPV